MEGVIVQFGTVPSLCCRDAKIINFYFNTKAKRQVIVILPGDKKKEKEIPFCTRFSFTFQENPNGIVMNTTFNSSSVGGSGGYVKKSKIYCKLELQHRQKKRR